MPPPAVQKIPKGLMPFGDGNELENYRYMYSSGRGPGPLENGLAKAVSDSLSAITP